MFARSVLWSLRDIGDCVTHLHAEPMLHNNPVTVNRSNAARSTIRDLVEMLRVARPRRLSSPHDRNDNNLENLLDAMYQQSSGAIEVLENTEKITKETITSLQSENQVRTGDGQVFVPLRGKGAAKNLPVALGIVIEQIERQLKRTQELGAKLRADGAPSNCTEYQLIQSLKRRLKSLHDVLRDRLSQLQIINYSVFVDKKIEQFMSEIIPNAFGTDITLEETQ